MTARKVEKLGPSRAAAPTATPSPSDPLLATMGYATYRNRASSLFIDDAVLQELQGRNAERTIDRMLLDAVVSGSVERTSLTLRGAPWTIEPGGPADIDQRFAERVATDIDELETGWPSTVASMAEALAWGFSLFEILFRADTDGYHWCDFSPREQRSIDHWDVDDGTGRLLQAWQRVTVSSGRYGVSRYAGRIPIPGWKLLHFRTHPASGRPEGRSLIRNAFLAWTDKQELRRILKTGLRRDFTGVGKYEVPAELLSKGATPEQKAALASAIQMVQEFERDQREGLVLPSSTKPGGTESTGYKFELIQSGGRRPLELTEVWRLYNREIALGLLSEYQLMGLEQVGTNAVGVSKTSFFERAIGAWLDNIAELMMHKALPVYQAFNPQFAGAKIPKFVHGDVDKRDLATLGAFIQQAMGSGGITPDPALEEWLRDQVGAPASTIDAPLPGGTDEGELGRGEGEAAPEAGQGADVQPVT